MRKPASFIACLLMLVAAHAARAATPAVGAVSLEQVIREVQKKQSTIKTLQAEFKQEKELALLSDKQSSKGTFAYSKPDKVRWNYSEPNQVSMLITSGKLTTFYPKLGRAEVLEVGRVQDRIFKYMGAGSAIDELAAYFNFRFTDRKGEKTWKLELDPKTTQVAKRVRRIAIWIDKESYLTSKIEYVEGDGDTTRYEFENVRINAPIPPDTFELHLPAGVKVERLKLN